MSSGQRIIDGMKEAVAMMKRHLNRYLAEFDFRQNNRENLGIDDVQRARHAIRGMAGRRLTYLDSSA